MGETWLEARPDALWCAHRNPRRNVDAAARAEVR